MVSIGTGKVCLVQAAGFAIQMLDEVVQTEVDMEREITLECLAALVLVMECQIIPETSIKGDTYKVVDGHLLAVAHGVTIGV